ncbi:MAG: amino acid adenylation domain-containing protein [Candidatus Rokubacteria bacterium]|nr:amino acid adenylation domain-containing protein [Candidatus Rokubacteria bacterium]
MELLQEYVARQAERRPEAVAVVLNGERLSYGRLESAANQLARLLQAAGCRRGDRVCLLTSKSIEAIVGIVGIYKADCIYVPVDPSSPAPRVAKILESCENRWILAGDGVEPLLDALFEADRFRAAISVGWLGRERGKGARFHSDFSLADLSAYSTAPPDCANRRHDAAHILFTSGSTGAPKGVVITHSSVAHFVEWARRYFGTTSADRMSAHPPLHFDLSVYDIFGTFAAGAQLHLVPPDLSILPNKLAEFVRTSELTQWFSVPSVLNYMAKFDVVRANDFPTLRRVLWCGEVFPTPALRYWMARLPHATFTNLYGPTETTIASSYYTVPRCPDDDRAAIPIGIACEGEELLLLDEHLGPTALGEPGDLYIGGVGLSPGYWRDPELTRAAFLPDPRGGEPMERIYRTGDRAMVGDDGLLYFLGRTDSQIKSRGYRIELGEVETALSAIEGVREGAVVAIQSGGFEGMLICAAYVGEPGREVTPVTLRRELGRTLPAYMLPSRWMVLGSLPRNANGKIDRRRLKEACEGDGAEATR